MSDRDALRQIQAIVDAALGAQVPPRPPVDVYPEPPPPVEAPPSGLGPIEGRYVSLGNIDNLETATVNGMASFHITTPYTLDFSCSLPRAITGTQDVNYKNDGGVQYSINGGEWMGGAIVYNWRAPGPGSYRIRVRKHNALTERGQWVQAKPLTAWAP